MENEEKKECDAIDREYLKEVQLYRHKSSDLFEKQLVYISGGAIVICLGLLQAEKSIVSDSNFCPFILGLASFIVTLLLNLVSHRSSISSMDAEIEGKVKKSENWDCVTRVVNYASICTVILGLVSIFVTVVKMDIS